ncbi:unnamed protein product [Brassicogethes aeneus]|uniref:Uncharacterized protein n=1 Tax=Brassicogethes aeneus TaxID=1431903 RepID=A0A9P0BJ99_BRAAE|nr:unnamed protein product [Brassicogethes aeneus]
MITKQLTQDVEEILLSAFQKKEILAVLVTSLANSITTLLEQKLAGMQDELKKVSENCISLENKYTELNERHVELEKKYKQKTNNIEQYTRRSNLRISGMKETSSENVEEKFIEICKTKLNIDLRSKIDRCHRIGKVNKSNQDKPRGVLVQFSNYKVKWQIYTNKKSLQGTGISIKEDLTQEQLALYKEACEKFGFKNTWTVDGKVMVFENSEKKIYKKT